MAEVIIENIIYCETYKDAIKISKAFENFRINFICLGGKHKVQAKRFINKVKSHSNPYHVYVRYCLKYKGEFLEYGYIDERTMKKYPNIVKELQQSTKNDRWKIASKYQNIEDNYCRDIYYYNDFLDFLNNTLKKYLDRIYLTGVIAFANQYRNTIFTIYFEECGKTFEVTRNYLSFDNECLIKDEILLYTEEFIAFQKVWEWIENTYWSNKDKDFSEPRVLTALSYVLNRSPFECLLYSLIGLESVFTKDEHHVKAQLKSNIPLVFEFINDNDIEMFYKMRSNFVHGDIIFPNYYDRKIMNYKEIKYYKHAEKAACLLLLTIRLLVRNDALKIIFNRDGTLYYKNGITINEYFEDNDMNEDVN